MNKKIKSNIMPTYGERDLEFVKGKDCYLFTSDGKKYLDFAGGIAVNSLGHCHPKLVKAIKKQAETLWHTSNLYYNQNQEEYANMLCKNSFADKVFFTNSGAEAIECGIKVIRSYWNHHKKNKKKIITFDGAFHGRTFAAISAQQNAKYSSGFEPLLPGFCKASFNDISSLESLIDSDTAAILIEPIQGEGGIRTANLDFLKSIRDICNQNNILLFLDEVQSGFGRSGKMFSYEWADIKPDILASAKGIGSGFPMGACLSTNQACIGMSKGTHGSTYGGNALAVSVGKAVLEIIGNKNFLESVDKTARYLWKKLKKLEQIHEDILEIRGAGLLLGIKTKSNNLKVSQALKKNFLLNVTASENVVRLAPPLIITKENVDDATNIIDKTFKELND